MDRRIKFFETLINLNEVSKRYECLTIEAILNISERNLLPLFDLEKKIFALKLAFDYEEDESLGKSSDIVHMFFETTLSLYYATKHYSNLTLGNMLEITANDLTLLFNLGVRIKGLRYLFETPIIEESKECLPEPGEEWIACFNRYKRHHGVTPQQAMQEARVHWHRREGNGAGELGNSRSKILESLPTPVQSDSEDDSECEVSEFDERVLFSKNTEEYANIRSQAYKNNALRQTKVKENPEAWCRWGKSKISAVERYYLLSSAEGNCIHCGKHLTMKTLTIDHIIPKSKTGLPAAWDLRNFGALCRKCNSKKGARLLCDVGMRNANLTSITHSVVREMSGVDNRDASDTKTDFLVMPKQN